ncbi:MAG: hypothetical protein ACREXK_14300 [Gammaproteobacteria bacterium]
MNSTSVRWNDGPLNGIAFCGLGIADEAEAGISRFRRRAGKRRYRHRRTASTGDRRWDRCACWKRSDGANVRCENRQTQRVGSPPGTAEGARGGRYVRRKGWHVPTRARTGLSSSRPSAATVERRAVTVAIEAYACGRLKQTLGDRRFRSITATSRRRSVQRGVDERVTVRNAACIGGRYDRLIQNKRTTRWSFAREARPWATVIFKAAHPEAELDAGQRCFQIADQTAKYRGDGRRKPSEAPRVIEEKEYIDFFAHRIWGQGDGKRNGFIPTAAYG